MRKWLWIHRDISINGTRAGVAGSHITGEGFEHTASWTEGRRVAPSHNILQHHGQRQPAETWHWGRGHLDPCPPKIKGTSVASWEEELCGQRVDRFPGFSYQFLFQPNMRISGTALNPFGDRRACTQFHRWDERVGRSYLWILSSGTNVVERERPGYGEGRGEDGRAYRNGWVCLPRA